MAKQWEYKLIAESHVGDLEAELNRLGEDGWELVAFGGSMVLKRQKKRPKKPKADEDAEPRRAGGTNPL